MPQKQSSIWLAAAFYAVTVGGAILLFFAIESIGVTLNPVGSVKSVMSGSATSARVVTLVQVLVALAVVVAAAQLSSRLFTWLKQPAVIGEVIAGLLLGPSCLGAISPKTMQFLLPPVVGPVLSSLAQIAVILYMFLVGLEFDSALLRRRAHSSVAISHASIVVPFVLGSAVALLLYPRLAGVGVSFTAFALFCGAAMSVTAFPVLARILVDRGIQTTPIGVIATACAAVDDVTAWCLLAFVVSFVKASSPLSGLAITAMALAYIGVMLGVVKPLMLRVLRKHGGVTRTLLAALFLSLLLSSLATELIGIHAIFGAFLLGVIIPSDSPIAKETAHRVEDLVIVLLLPIFFAYTGTRVQIGLLEGVRDWALCGLIVMAACMGKFGGSAVAARFTGLGWRDSIALGTLMNTRGLVELIVLNVGLDLGVLSPTLFTMLVIMAVVTTMMTTPVLQLLDLLDRRSLARSREAAPSMDPTPSREAMDPPDPMPSDEPMPS